MTDTATTSTNDPALERARMLLRPLSPEVREQVVAKLDLTDEQRQVLLSEDTAPAKSFHQEMAQRRKMMREAALRIHERNLEKVREANATALSADDSAPRSYDHDPLDQLRMVHPAALATAMQGERAEAWALVIDYLDPVAKTALLSYLDMNARRAIEAAQLQQQSLPPQLVDAARRAIQQAVVPRALQEHHRLLTTPIPPTRGLAPA